MEQGHKPDEFIEKAELARCDAMCDRLLDHLCNGGA
jgi:acetylornithine deacetylase